MMCHNYMLREFSLVSYINIVTDEDLVKSAHIHKLHPLTN
jgi:hypothetical protein